MRFLSNALFYLFLYPTGHFVDVPETFRTTLPFVQVIVTFFGAVAAFFGSALGAALV